MWLAKSVPEDKIDRIEDKGAMKKVLQQLTRRSYSQR
jgi:hypothetical protein